LTAGVASTYFYVIKKNTVMKDNKTLEVAGFAGILTIFAASFIIYFNFLKQAIHFIVNSQITGIHH